MYVHYIITNDVLECDIIITLQLSISNIFYERRQTPIAAFQRPNGRLIAEDFFSFNHDASTTDFQY